MDKKKPYRVDLDKDLQDMLSKIREAIQINKVKTILKIGKSATNILLFKHIIC